MKKVYVEIELDVISLADEDVITTSTYSYDPDNILGGNNNEEWKW